jgi:hypothetical protein
MRRFKGQTVVDNLVAANLPKSLKFQYDFADLGGATNTTIVLTDDANAAQTIPDNAVIVSGYLETLTTLTADGSPTVAIGFLGNTDAFTGATAYNGAIFTTEAASEFTLGELPIKLDGATGVTARVATNAVTAGKFNVWVEYYEGD